MNAVTKPPGEFAAASANESADVASVEAIRSQFPALSRRHSGKPVAYFDGPGGTQVPRMVVEAMSEYLYDHNANTHWNYPTSAETDRMFTAARQALADFLGGQPNEIVFGANATSLAFHVSRALARRLSPGDEIVVTELDHHANVGPWQVLARERDCKLIVVRMDIESGGLDWNDFEQRITKRTRLIAIGAASNALGTISDVHRAAKIARAIGALTYVDAVHYAPHKLADVRALECDFLMCSAYKFYGPHVGVLWCRGDVLESLPFAKLEPAPDTGPERAETGTLNHEGIAGAAAAVDFIASLAPGAGRREKLRAAFTALHDRSAVLTNQVWTAFASNDRVQLYGPPPGAARTSTIAFTVRGIASSEVARQLADRGLFLSHGNFYAATVIDRLGLAPEGLVRAGCACYTTQEEAERLIFAVEEISR